MLPEGNRLPLDNNRRSLLGGVSYLDPSVLVAGTFDPSTGAQLVAVTQNASSLPTTPINGQKSVTTSASSIGTATFTEGVVVKALSTNTASIFVGDSNITTSTGYELIAGECVSLPVRTLANIYCISSTGTQTLSYIGS